MLGNAWSIEYLKVVMKGIRKCAEENNTDIFLFVNYSTNGEREEVNIGDANILHLLDYADFDGIILLANTFHLKEEYDYIIEKLKNINVPAVSLEYEIPGAKFYGSDNDSGMYELCKHILEEHGVKNVMYISGPEDNEENIARRRSLEEALRERGLELKEENVICCNWNYAEVLECLPDWLDQCSELPDAVVCANDMMAMATCTILEDRGIQVPSDVIVTGFDHIETAAAFSPSIATVGRKWDDIGYRAVKYLLCTIEGKEFQDMEYAGSVAIPSESCGCHMLESDISRRMIERRDSYNRFLSGSNIVIHICNLADTLSRAASAEQLRQMFIDAPWDFTCEGNELYVCLSDNFFSSLYGGTPIPKVGYTEKTDVIFGLKDGKIYERELINTSELLPACALNEKDPKLYVFLPTYGDEGCFGYVVFGEERPMMYDYSLYNWMRHMNQSLGRVRQNVAMNVLNNSLSKLSITDPLTGVYNRMGCERKAYPYLEECHSQGKNAVLMFADINRMKLINDNFGHLQGDFAICTVAKAITDVLQDEWIVVRYGGDEFIMVGECVNEEEVELQLRKIEMCLENTKSRMQLPYNLKVSLGYVLVRPEESLNMSECLTRAEDAMYVMKKRLHEEMN